MGAHYPINPHYPSFGFVNNDVLFSVNQASATDNSGNFNATHLIKALSVEIQPKFTIFETQNPVIMVSALNEAQRTLLELLAEPLTEQDLEQLRTILVQFRYRRLQNLLNAQWDERGWAQETMDKWYQEHNRTPYRLQPNGNQ